MDYTLSEAFIRYRTLAFDAPVIYQEINGAKQIVAGNYTMHSPSLVGFQVAEYDKERPLIIDPVLIYATYLGGTDEDFANDIALDSFGNFYVVGQTNSGQFGTRNQGKLNGDIYVVKYNPEGSAILYTTHLASGPVGIVTTPEDDAFGVDVDSAGNAYVTGFTRGLSFPETTPISNNDPNGQGERVVAFKLDSSGTLAYSLILGGGRGQDIAASAMGEAHITGYTNDPSFLTQDSFQIALSDDPVRNCSTIGLNQSTFFPGVATISRQTCRDAFVTKLNADASAAVFSTYLGGNDADGGSAIALDSSGNAYVTGLTASSVDFVDDIPNTVPQEFVTEDKNFPLVNPLQDWLAGSKPGCCPGNPLLVADAFVTQFSPSGATLFSTYWGDEGFEEGVGIDVDNAGDVYLVARDVSGFVTKIRPSIPSVVYETAVGEDGVVTPLDIAVDTTGSAWITGFTGGLISLGGSDSFLIRLKPDGFDELFNFSFGSGGENTRGHGMALDSINEIAYVAGFTNSEFLPISLSLNPLQLFSAGGTDAFVYILNGHQPEIILGPTAAPDLLPSTGVTNLSVTATDNKSHELSYRWINAALASQIGDPIVKCHTSDSGGFSDPSAQNPTWTAPVNSTDTNQKCGLLVTVTDTEGLSVIGSTFVTVEPSLNSPPTANAGTDQTLECVGNVTPATLDGSASSDPDGDSLGFEWTGIFGTAAGINPIVSLELGTHPIVLEVDDGNGGLDSDSLFITVEDTTPPIVDAGPDVILEAKSASGATFTVMQASSDTCSDVVVTQSPDQTLFPLGATTVTVNVVDDSGNTASDSLIVTVQDTTLPILTVPANLTVEANAVLSTVDIGIATATDILPVTIVNDAPTGGFPLGTTPVTWMATDTSGNIATGTQQVTIVDTTPPDLTVPANISVECNEADGVSINDAAVQTFLNSATATDIVDSTPVVTNNAPALLPTGSTDVTFTATDFSGNSAAAIATVTVVDTTPPTLSLSVSPTVLWPPNHKMIPIDVTVAASDVCDPNPAVELILVQSSEGYNVDTFDPAFDVTEVVSKKGNDIQLVDGQLFLRAERSGDSDGRVYAITYEAVDASGNSTTATTTVEVPHNQ